MPVVGEPIPFPFTLLIPRPNATVRQAVEKLAAHFPRPNTYASWIGFNLRKRRLGVELAEFDLLYRLRHGKPADLERLCRVGEAIILPAAARFPTLSLPVDEPLFVRPKTLAWLIRVSDAASTRTQSARGRKRRAKPSSKQGDTP